MYLLNKYVRQSQACNGEQGDVVLALPSGAEMGPPSTVEAEQLLGQRRAGEVREGFLEEGKSELKPNKEQAERER